MNTLGDDPGDVMRQSWRDLLFLHWPVPAEALTPLLPPGLMLDTFDGQAYVGLVPFTMRGVRPTGTPPFAPLSNFHETNVRTYVRRAVDGTDPGVWFFSLDAANAVAVRLARAWFKLPYFFARMRLDRDENGTTLCASERRWPAPVPARVELRYRVSGDVFFAAPDSLEFFLAERYRLYTIGARGRLFSGRVHHAPYPLQAATVLDLHENLIAAAGIVRPDGPPPLAHYASGVDVRVSPLRPC